MIPQADQPGSSIRGQTDRGATVSCSNAKTLFHNCEECDDKIKSPVGPCTVTNHENDDVNSVIAPKGEGHLPVPAVKPIERTLALTEDNMLTTTPFLDAHTLRAMSKLQHPQLWPAQNEEQIECKEANVSAKLTEQLINAMQSKSATQEEHAPGFFTQKKLKTLATWVLWHAGETKQPDQFEQPPQMFGEPAMADTRLEPITLRPHWQHNVECDETRRTRLCCNGSECAAPMLHALALTHSPCVEHPVQRLFCAIAAGLNKKAHGGDAKKDACAHSPGSEIKTHMQMDDAHAEWCWKKHGKPVDRRKALPTLGASQGSPESGRLWEAHCNKTIMSKPLNFKTTTHDKTMHCTLCEGETMHMPRQVDNFALACDNMATAIEMHNIIGAKLQLLPKEGKDPFAHLRLVKDFDGMDTTQARDHVKLSCADCVDRIMTSRNDIQQRQSRHSFATPNGCA